MKEVIHIQKVSREEDPFPTLEALALATGLAQAIKPGQTVLIKPNLVAPFPLATTDPDFIRFFIHFVKNCGATPIVGETSGFEFSTNDTIEILGIRQLLEEHDTEFINFEEQEYTTITLDTGQKVDVASISQTADHIINLPVLKGHTITKMTGAIKNLFGLLSKPSRRQLHCSKLHAGIAALGRAYPNLYNFVDARILLTRAVFGDTLAINSCLGGRNPFSLDHFGCGLLGIQPDAVDHIENIPEYTIEGYNPKISNTLSSQASLKKKLHRALYSTFYWLDEVKAKTLGGKSIIPELHWSLGLHPDVSKLNQQELAEVAKLCPVNAISVEKGTIIKDKCINVRCLQCFTKDPSKKVEVKGLNPPKRP